MRMYVYDIIYMYVNVYTHICTYVRRRYNAFVNALMYDCRAIKELLKALLVLLSYRSKEMSDFDSLKI